jgi:hypothetical protein
MTHFSVKSVQNMNIFFCYTLQRGFVLELQHDRPFKIQLLTISISLCEGTST